LQWPPSGRYGVITSLIISAGGREGLLQAFVSRDDQPALTGDVCSAEVTARFVPFLGGPGAICEAFLIDGVAFRVTTEQDPERGEVKTAARMLEGGILGVISQQGRTDYSSSDTSLPPDAAHTSGPGADHLPPLGTPMFSSQQVAAIAANPAMLP
jgi:hypothetical protein